MGWRPVSHAQHPHYAYSCSEKHRFITAGAAVELFPPLGPPFKALGSSGDEAGR